MADLFEPGTDEAPGKAESNGTTDAPRGVLAKLHLAQEAVKPVSKSGKNEQQGYAYIRAEDVVAEGQRALRSAGLVASMNFTEQRERDVASKSGTAGIYVTLTGTLRISDPESEQSVEVPCFGAGIDYPGDKAVYKAMTGAAKYAYSSALGIASEGEAPAPDTDRSPQTVRASEEEQTAAKHALKQLVEGDSKRALEVYAEALGHFGNICPKGLAILLIRLGGTGEAVAPPATATPGDAA